MTFTGTSNFKQPKTVIRRKGMSSRINKIKK